MAGDNMARDSDPMEDIIDIAVGLALGAGLLALLKMLSEREENRRR